MGAFISHVWEMGKRHGRPSLPWRQTTDPYAIYISEVMLQQTQVARVQKYWPAWLGAFPTIDALAAADTSDVLEHWQGLGYNRRALNIKRSADVCAARYGGLLPQTYQELVALPGIGPATAAGVMAFAHNQAGMYLETNVRAVFIHHFFADTHEQVSDQELIPLVEASCSQESPREWYYALLDYGAYLKATQPNPTRKARAYSRQGAFEGSKRQKRAFILREVLANPGIGRDQLHDWLNEAERCAERGVVSRAFFEGLVDQLIGEGFFHDREGHLVP